MFGYVIANLEGLTQAQKDRYKGCYCGLCRVLKQRHGFSGRLTLTYDMTFLVLLLSALYEADEERGMEVCPAHPLRKHFYWQTRYTEYAADMNVVLAYNNCRAAARYRARRGLHPECSWGLPPRFFQQYTTRGRKNAIFSRKGAVFTVL